MRICVVFGSEPASALSASASTTQGSSACSYMCRTKRENRHSLKLLKDAVQVYKREPPSWRLLHGLRHQLRTKSSNHGERAFRHSNGDQTGATAIGGKTGHCRRTTLAE